MWISQLDSEAIPHLFMFYAPVPSASLVVFDIGRFKMCQRCSLPICASD